MSTEDEELREFESAANKTAIDRQHAMESAQRTCLELRIEIQQLTKERDRAIEQCEKAEAVANESAPLITDLTEGLKKAETETERLRTAMATQRERVERLLDARDAEKLRAEKAEAKCKELDAQVRNVRTIPGCEHTTERMAEWNHQGACPICLTAALGMANEARDKAEAACAEFRYSLTQNHASNCSIQDSCEPHCDCGFEQASIHALSSDCGRGYIPASELDGTIELLNYLERSGFDLPKTIAERIRLESLRKGK